MNKTSPCPPEALECATRLRRNVSQFYRHLRPALVPEGLSMAKLSVLAQIKRSGAMTPSRLAALERVRLQTLTRLLAELEAAGWLRRVPDQSDGRQSSLFLTASGARRLARSAKDSDAELAGLIEKVLDDKERNQLNQACDLLSRLDEALCESLVDSHEVALHGHELAADVAS